MITISLRQAFVILTLVAFAAGLIAQFVWKMIYYPEPLIPVICEVCGIVIAAGLAIWCVWREK
ncbi:hypothetical protein ES708_22325 [subsurface metagenome]